MGLFYKIFILNYIPNQLIRDILYANMNIFNKIIYEGCYKVLRILCREYEWLKTENKGNKPMIKTKEQLSYYATLMKGWINSKPLKYLIQKAITWYHNSGNSKDIFLSIDGRKYQEKFDRNNDFHINTLINNLINDLENNVKYSIKTYVSNYQSILESTNLGLVCDWAEYIDYGTTDSNIIEIQNLVFSRTIAIFLLDNCSSLFIRNDIGEIIDIDEEELRTNIDKEKYSEEYKELTILFEWEK